MSNLNISDKIHFNNIWYDYYWNIRNTIEEIISKKIYISITQNYKEMSITYSIISNNINSGKKLSNEYKKHDKYISKITLLIIKNGSINKIYEKWKKSIIRIALIYHNDNENIVFETIFSLLKDQLISILNEIYSISRGDIESAYCNSIVSNNIIHQISNYIASVY